MCQPKKRDSRFEHLAQALATKASYSQPSDNHKIVTLNDENVTKSKL